MAKLGQYRHNQPAFYSYHARRHIGVLGGSFNPAHDGHIALSKRAYQSSHCDQIWWLVSPQNPLKSENDMADFAARLAYAKICVAAHPWIKIVSLESQSRSNYSFDTMQFLKSRSPRASFTWLMGTDNLVQLPRWHRAKEFATHNSCLVFRRDASFYAALASKGRALFPRSNGLKLDRQFCNRQSATALRQVGHPLMKNPKKA